MKAALIIMERYPDTGITFVPENVNALVTPGLTRDPITLPAVERVIGGETLHLDNSNPDNTNPGLAAVAGEARDHRLDGRPGRRHQSNRRVTADDVYELRKFETRNRARNKSKCSQVQKTPNRSVLDFELWSLGVCFEFSDFGFRIFQ